MQTERCPDTTSCTEEGFEPCNSQTGVQCVEVQKWSKSQLRRPLHLKPYADGGCHLWAADKAGPRISKNEENDWKRWIKDKLEEKVDKLQNMNGETLFSILKPKQMVAKHAGKMKKALPGFRNLDNKWCEGKHNIAIAWQTQFGQIEHAVPVDVDVLQKVDEPQMASLKADDLLQVPSLFDVEFALRQMNINKASGLDNLGAELFVTDAKKASKTLFPLFLKTVTRSQNVPEFCGGWLLPLHKGKLHPSNMSGFRAILLEPVVSRIFAKAWRSRLEEGAAKVALPSQWGGRPGLSCSALHLQLKMWQQNAKQERKAHAIVYVDLQQAFYSVAKPLLAKCNSWQQSVEVLCTTLKIPDSAVEKFCANVAEADLIYKATGSRLAGAMTRATLEKTWFTIPNGDKILAPQSGSRPGDPLADLFFSVVMSSMMSKIHESLEDADLLQPQSQQHPCPSSITWVDDIAFCITSKADGLCQKVIHVMQILLETATEHGFALSYGQGKTAVMMMFHGPKAKQARIDCEKKYKDGLPVLSEHRGMVVVPIVNHYKHLGGTVTRQANLMPEIRIRSAQSCAKLQPLRKILQHPGVKQSHKRQLLKTMAWPVLTLHCGSWFQLNEGEYKAWQGAWFRLCGFLYVRNDEGEVTHTHLCQRSWDCQIPMPMETLYLSRLKLCCQILQENDQFSIAAILHNAGVAGDMSWLYGVQCAIEWMCQQIGVEWMPEGFQQLDQYETWNKYQTFAKKWKLLIGKAEKAHMLRVRAMCDLVHADREQQRILKEMGWLHEEPNHDEPEEMSEIRCLECGANFHTEASLAVHQQRKHKHRIAMRRLVQHTCCFACSKQFHTRARVLQHLHFGTTTCWIKYLRNVEPLSVEQATELDDQDRQRGIALHQRGIKRLSDDQACRTCTEQELNASPAVIMSWDEVPDHEPCETELQTWKQIGLLPPGQGGRDVTIRQQTAFTVPNVLHDVQQWERQMVCDVSKWKPPEDQVPRPLACNLKFVLLFFAGHRRSFDVADWISRESGLVPIPIDTAIDENWGNVFDDRLWWQLIAARRVVAGHGGPPCESFSLARWLEVEGQKYPRPLRDSTFPWGLPYRNLREVLQSTTGEALFLRVVILLMFIFQMGGAVSLEHPRGPPEGGQAWCVWFSAILRRWQLERRVNTMTFLQGPLGREFSKPTTMLIGRLEDLPKAVYQAYQPGWKPTTTLGGKAADGSWRTAAAKQYPEVLCREMARAYIRYPNQIQTEGEESDPPQLEEALKVLTFSWDPYQDECKQMRQDFQPSHCGL